MMDARSPTDYKINPWLRQFRASPSPRMRLICFPPAGAGAGFYRFWGKLSPSFLDVVVVQYPGREDRVAEPCKRNMSALVDGIAESVDTLNDLPMALFGHSMGAAVAHEVAKRRESAGLRIEHLFVSGRPPPHLQRKKSIHLLDDDGVIEEIIRLGGTSAAVLENLELRRLLMPSIRNDFRLIETYSGNLEPMLRAPVSALIGDADTEVTADEANDWRKSTSGSFLLDQYPGGHFYLNVDTPRVVNAIASRLELVTWPNTP